MQDLIEELLSRFELHIRVFHQGRHCGKWSLDLPGSWAALFHLVLEGLCCKNSIKRRLPVPHSVLIEMGELMVNFKGAHFQKELILTCVRWNVAYPLNYRDLEKMMEERGVLVDHSTIKMDGKAFSEQYGAYLRVFALYDSWVGELLKLNSLLLRQRVR